ncbi:MAG: hypothetical protein IPJ16_18370 [Bacteroidales bacterium]|nr:hypothetical protein [Bacteroidales bacterium]
MKKLLLLFYSTLIIVLLSTNYSFGQSCTSTSQSVEDIPSLCVNSASTTTLYGSNNWLYECDQYGWCDEYWWANPITVKKT